MSFSYTSYVAANAATADLAKNDAAVTLRSHDSHNKPPPPGGFFFTNKLIRNDYQEMINSIYNYQHNYSISSSSVSSLDSSYSSRSSQLSTSSCNYAAQSTCSSPSASLDEQAASSCLSASSTSSLSSVNSTTDQSFQQRLQNQPNWSSVIYTPHLYPMLYEPCDYYYSPSPGYAQHHHYNQLNQAEFEELDQNVNDLINSGPGEAKLFNKKLKDITNHESESLFVMSKYGVKKWSQPNTTNKSYYSNSNKKVADMENQNRMNKRYVNTNTNTSNNNKSTLAYSAVVIRNPAGFVSNHNNNNNQEASKAYYGKKSSSFNSTKQHVGVRGYKSYQCYTNAAASNVSNGFNNNVIGTTQQQQQQSSNKYRSSGHILLKTRS